MVAPYCPKSVFGLDYRIILIIINPHKIDVIAQYKLVVIHLSWPCSKYSSDINHTPKEYSVFILWAIYLSEYSSVITLSVHIYIYTYIYIYMYICIHLNSSEYNHHVFINTIAIYIYIQYLSH